MLDLQTRPTHDVTGMVPARWRTYLRFSSLEQAEGTSIKRQREDTLGYAAENSWEVIDTLVDAGKSAFSGRNREADAELGRFIEEVRVGLHHGTGILVERIDRLSRQGFDDTYDLVRLCTRNGVAVATVEGRCLYRAGVTLNEFQVMEMLMRAKVAHEESVKKSQRLRRRYDIKREEARLTGKAMSKLGPPWLEIGKDGKWKIIKGRDKVIVRVFELADMGHGSLSITRILNSEGVAPWPRFKGRVAREWGRTTVSRILSDRAVVGEHQPNQMVNGKAEPIGEVWRDHFPKIIEEGLFARVSGAAKARQSPAGRKSAVVANIVSGLVRCQHCGSPMEYKRRRAEGRPYVTKPAGNVAFLKHEDAALQCRSAYYGSRSCSNRKEITYYGFERALLDSLLHLALDDRSFTRKDELGRLTVAIAEKRRELEIARDGAKAMWTAYRETKSRMAMEEAHAVEGRADALETEVASLEKAAKKASGEADAEQHLSRIAEIRRHLYDSDLDVRAIHRRKVSEGFRSIIEKIVCRDDGSAFIHLKAGTRLIQIGKGKVMLNIDLHKPGRELSHLSKPDRMAVEAYLKRAVAA